MENDVSQRITMCRKHFGMTADEFAIKCNINRVTVYRIQNGEGDASHKTLKSISAALNVNYQWLLTGKGKMLTDPKDPAPALEKTPYAKALELLEDQLRKKDEQIASLLAVVSKLNFLDPLNDAMAVRGPLRVAA